jgi:hypothetical protein
MKTAIVVGIVIVVAVVIGFVSIFGKRSIAIGGTAPLESVSATALASASASFGPDSPAMAGASPSPTSSGNYTAPLTGASCASKPSRPIAVMISSDPEARPLNGLSDADMVFEMPVINQVTRMMAVFSCKLPRKIGAIRSARTDYLAYAFGLNAILTHFGGEHEVLARLNSGVINNVDCIKFDGTTCLRDGRPRPNNAYVTADLLKKQIKEDGYSMTRASSSFSFDATATSQGTAEPPELYTEQFAVHWTYNVKQNVYFRSRDGSAEIDGNTRTQINARNVVILKTTEQKVSPLYNRVKTVGSGDATVYKNGTITEGTWKKTTEKSALELHDKKGGILTLAPGQTWFEVVTNGAL